MLKKESRDNIRRNPMSSWDLQRARESDKIQVANNFVVGPRVDTTALCQLLLTPVCKHFEGASRGVDNFGNV
jgi:hypothetical protein